MRADVLLFSLLLICMMTPAWSVAAQDPQPQGWRVSLSGHVAGPPLMVAVSKSRQKLYVFKQSSPMALKNSYVCTTGEKVGDKFAEGDLRTPEGVYFTERRLDSGLDWDLYGTLAYTLNFPNPVDRLREKTGSGIWIHGRGHEIVPRETKGCVALYDPEMAKLEQDLVDLNLEIGAPVVIAEDLDWAPGDSNAPSPENLEVLVKQWALAWQAMSPHFFEFYDRDRFTKAHRETFTEFENHKRGLFDRLDWIQVAALDVNVLPGPDYWVTWFNQYYRSPNLVSAGVKRLYWMKDDTGALRIVGREFVEGDADLESTLESQYLKRVTLEMEGFVEAWRSSWERADLDAYASFYAEEAAQGGRIGKEAIRDHKVGLWQSKPPERVAIDDMALSLHPMGVEVTFEQRYEAAGNYADRGRKTLVLKPSVQGWRIVQEDWSAL